MQIQTQIQLQTQRYGDDDNVVFYISGKTGNGMGAESECARGKSSIDTPGNFSPLCQT